MGRFTPLFETLYNVLFRKYIFTSVGQERCSKEPLRRPHSDLVVGGAHYGQRKGSLHVAACMGNLRRASRIYYQVLYKS